MTRDEVTALASTGDSEVLEFKATTRTRREAAATVCSLLNQRGEHVLFGVAQDGRIVGQQVSERTVEEVNAEFRRIDPPAFPEIERVRLDGKPEVIVIGVSPGPLGRLFASYESRPWNPLIAKIFYQPGIIEEWGCGTITMAELAASAGRRAASPRDRRSRRLRNGVVPAGSRGAGSRA